MKNALLVSAFFLLPIQLLSQGIALELLPGADELEYDKRTGIHTLRGNISFNYQSNTMYCDSALFNEKKNTVRAYGNVHINKKDTLNLFCDSLFYHGKERKAKLWGNVRMRDREYRLITDTLEYDAKKSQASYHHGGVVESSITGERLTSTIGYFHPDSKNFFFSHNVNYKGLGLTMTTDTLQYVYSQSKTQFHGATNIHMEGADMYCESGWYNTASEEGSLRTNAWIAREGEYISGDTLEYFPNQGEYEGKGNVYYIDSVQQMEFTGDYAYHSDSLHMSLLTGRALASKSMDNDTLFIHADTLYTYRDSLTSVFKAYRGARLYSREFQGQADSISFIKDSNRVEFFTDPIFWSNGAELKGLKIDLFLKDSIIERVDVIDKANVLMEVAVDSFYNQVAGSLLQAYFVDNELRTVTANGNAQTIFFPEDEENRDSVVVKKRMGMNRLYSSFLKVYIDSNEVVGITYHEEPDGVMYPLNQIKKEEQFIPGFIWRNELRPESLKEIFGIIEEDLSEIGDLPEEIEQEEDLEEN